MPSELLDVNYGAAARAYLSERVTLRRIHRFAATETQFGDALVTSAVIAFEKRIPDPRHQALLTRGGSLEAPEVAERVEVERLRGSTRWARFPAREPGETSPDGLRLGDLFTIQRGIATGSNAFFILRSDALSARGIPREFLRPILPSPRHLTDEVIEADDDGFPRLERSLVLVDCDRPEAELRDRAPGLADYIAEGRARGLAERYLASRRTPWYAQERRAPAPFVCTYMARPREGASPFRFFWNRSRATAPNVFLLLYPRGPLQDRLLERPELHARIFAHLRTIPARSFAGEGRIYGGGLHKIEPRELARLPVEDWDLET